MQLNSPIDLINIKGIENVDEVLQQINEKEAKICAELENLLLKQCQIESKTSGITRGRNKINVIHEDAVKLNSQILRTAKLSESVSAKVRRLDKARNRVSECQQRVHDLIDLQLCSQGVLTAINEEDYETGAGHINRFLGMDIVLLKRTADDIQSSLSSVSEAVRTLESASNTMHDMIVKRFEEAVRKDDLASVERLFKIFPLLHRHSEGIEKFSNYICSKIALKAQRELRNTFDIAKAEKRTAVAFGDTFTCLMENFARVIEVNQPIIEACYGPGYLLDMFAVLQHQCDTDVKNIVLEFNKSRKIAYKMQQIKDQTQNSSNNASSTTTLGHFRKASDGSTTKLSHKELDTCTAEIAMIHSRAELYFRFMRRRIAADIEQHTADKSIQEKKIEELNKTLEQSYLSKQMQELLGTYLLFERYLMEESIVKAIAMDSFEDEQQCSSVVDDVFFIVRKSIRRALSTQSINGSCAIINIAATFLHNNFVKALRAPLKAGYPSGYIDLAQAYNAIQSTLQQGKLQANDSEKTRMNFLVQLNNADVSTEYIETLWETMEKEIHDAFPGMTKTERQIVDNCIGEFKSVRDALKTCVDFGIQQLCSSAIKPRLHPWVDQYHTYKHHLSEDELSAYNAGGTFIQYLIVQVDGLLNTFKQILTERNFDALVSILANELALHLERAIHKCTYNRLGGLILDQEVRALSSYLAGATSWSIRPCVTRLSQIATILNLEKISELNDYWNPDKIAENPSWRLTANEVRTILTLRSDFRMEDIKRIKL